MLVVESVKQEGLVDDRIERRLRIAAGKEKKSSEKKKKKMGSDTGQVPKLFVRTLATGGTAALNCFSNDCCTFFSRLWYLREQMSKGTKEKKKKKKRLT